MVGLVISQTTGFIDTRSQTLTLNGSVGENRSLNNVTFSSLNIESNGDLKMLTIGNNAQIISDIGKNIITLRNNISETFEVTIPNNEVSIKIKGTAVENNNFSTLLLTQITESAIVDSNIMISSPHIGNTLVSTRIDNLPHYYPGINEVTLGLVRPINLILPPNSICNFTNDTPLTVNINGIVKVNGKELNNNSAVIKLNPYQEILMRGKLELKECNFVNSFDDQNDNGGEGFALIGVTKLVEVY